MNVFNAIVNKNIKQEINGILTTESFHLGMDDNALSFYPVYILPEKRQKIILNKYLEDIAKKLQSEGGSTEERAPFIKKYEEIQYFLKNIEYDEQDAKIKEEQKNSELKLCKKIGIKLQICWSNS